MKRIPLHDRAGVVVAYALVDADTFAKYGDIRWSLSSAGYVQNRERNVRLHRLVMGLENGDVRQVDHRNQDRLDNRRVNLRVVDRVGNAQNRPSAAGSRSSFRGVFARPNGRWKAEVRQAGRTHYLGDFDTEAEAAAAASAGRRLLMPFANESRKAEAPARTSASLNPAAG